MKTVINIFLALGIALLSSISAVAATTNPTTSKNNLREQVVSLIGKRIPVKANGTINAQISFMVNDKNEIVIIDVTSENTELSTYIKNKLNYQKVNITKEYQKEIYELPIKVNKA